MMNRLSQKQYNKLKSKILFILCCQAVSISMDCYLPVPSTNISRYCGCSLYYARKALSELKYEGLIKSVKPEPVYTDDGVFLLGGYRITDAAKSTRQYKGACRKEKCIWRKLGINIEGDLDV